MLSHNNSKGMEVKCNHMETCRLAKDLSQP